MANNTTTAANNTTTAANNTTTAANNTEKMVKIKIELTRSEKDDVPVGVNGRTWLIKRGVYVDVPECVAEVLQHREEMLSNSIEFEDAHKNEN